MNQESNPDISSGEKKKLWEDMRSMEFFFGQPEKMLYEVLWHHSWDTQRIPDEHLKGVLSSAARAWDSRGKGGLRESWKNHGDALARDILRDDPEWKEQQKRNRALREGDDLKAA